MDATADGARPAIARATITAASRRRGLAVSVVEGVSAQAHSALTGLNVGGNAITWGFALLLGAGDPALGLCAAIPPLAATAQLLGAHWGARPTSRRRAVVVASTLSRIAWPLIAALPFLVADKGTALALFLFFWASSCALISFSGNLWVSWMADLVPASIRARYFALRTFAANVAGLLVGLAAGWVLDRWFGGVPRAGGGGDDELRARGFALLFGLAAVAGLSCGALLWIQPEPERRAAPRAGGLRAAFVQPFREAARTPGLRGLLLFVGLFGFTNGFAAPFWTPFQLQDVGMDYTTVNGVLVIVQGVGTMIALPLWGRLARWAGHRAVVAICVSVIATHPLYYLFASAARPWPIYCDAASSGLMWSGYNLAVFNLALALAQGPSRDRLYAVYATVAGIAQATSAVLGGTVVAHLPAHVTLGPLDLGGRQVVFLGTSLARVGCLLLFLRAVSEPRGKGLRAVIAAVPLAVKARVESWGFIERERR